MAKKKLLSRIVEQSSIPRHLLLGLEWSDTRILISTSGVLLERCPCCHGIRSEPLNPAALEVVQLSEIGQQRGCAIRAALANYHAQRRRSALV